LATDATGNLYITEIGNNVVREVSPGGIIVTVAGNGTVGYSGDGGPAISAKLERPESVAVGSSGNLYIADNFNFRVRRVTPGGTITTAAGNGTPGSSGDGGPATSAQLSPSSVAVDAAGNLYIADSDARVRKVTTSGIISTIAGGGTSYPGDGGPATSAQVFAYALAVDATGNVYVTEVTKNRVRKIVASGTISTVAGNGLCCYLGDNGAATSAQLVAPIGVAADSAGNVYIATSATTAFAKSRRPA
jgi:hypothetical protein